MSFSTTLGFFLHAERLNQAFFASAPFGDPSRPSPMLLNSIYLWGIIISGSPALTSHASLFLSRAIYHANNGSQSSSQVLIQHTIQAELLLACYFYHMGLGVEGKEHCDAALRLSMNEDIHKIRGVEISELYPSVNAIGLGEIMNGFWVSFLIDTFVYCLWGLPTVLPDQDSEQGRIDMPWPLDMEQYDKVKIKAYI